MKAVSENIQYRYEQKFVFNHKRTAFVEEVVNTNSANFHEIFKQRQVNNIYFDKPGLKFYSDHKTGNGNRRKIRIRWYGNTLGKVVNPVLEFKIREGELKIKKSYSLPGFEIEKGFDAKKIQQLFARANLPASVLDEIKDMEIHLMNSYSRRYFRSFNQHYRFTIDHALVYHKLLQEKNYFLTNEIDSERVILELKFGIEYISEAPKISEELPVKMTDFSKYVSGMEKLHSHLV